MKKIITISRQFSSGGREVAKRLSDKLGIMYYDNEIIEQIAEKTNLCPEYIKNMSEKFNINEYSLTFSHAFANIPTPVELIQKTQNEIILELAKEDCIIVGRCANHIIKEKTFKVFLYASDMEGRINRCYDKVPEDRDIPRKKMEKQILSVDKQREKYHSFYGDKNWSSMSNYDICVNTSTLGIKNSVDVIADSYKIFYK